MYQRYHIATAPAPDIAPSPSRFRVKVKKHRLALLLLEELFRYGANKEVLLSRPCVYGVFSGPFGGFAPREHLCVGCLRCTTQFPEIVEIRRNAVHEHLGDSYFQPDYIESVHYEARTGRIPVKGAGYRGRFGGDGWDGMWTDMSEIVRPTRDGIHGREFISTVVDIGPRPPFLTLDAQGRPTNEPLRTFSIPIPFFLDVPPASVASEKLLKILAGAAAETQTLVILRPRAIREFSLRGPSIVPLVSAGEEEILGELALAPQLIELDGWNERLLQQVQKYFPESVICVRLESGSEQELVQQARSGIRAFHLVADHHGRWPDGRFLLEVIRQAHQAFVDLNCRDEVTLLGSGGIVAAEHVPKAIICGLDAVALDTPVLAALQAQLAGECADRETSRFLLPKGLNVPWGIQRAKNLMASWRDQLLEVLGAMGLREVRRLRGEIGRAMFQRDLERETFSGIEGYVA